MKRFTEQQKNSTCGEGGFTLIEIAVVLVLIGLLLGSFIGSVTQRIETSQRVNTKQQLEDIKTALLGFVSVHGRLPCPAETGSAGEESPVGGGVCSINQSHGFVPGKTLGIDGAYNRDNLLIDVWGSPIRYSVTTSNSNAFTKAPEPDGIKGIWNNVLHVEYPLDPDLIICDRNSSSGSNCIAPPLPPPPLPPINKLTETAPFVVLSLGQDGGNFVTNLAPNSDQGENAGEFAVPVNVAGENLAYTVGANRVFVSKSYSSAGSTAGQFDDLIVWESPYIIYSHMMEAGKLP